MAGIAAGHNAVKQIHTTGYGLDDVAGSADTHQIADLVLGHVRFHLTDHLIHHFGGLAHSQTADGVAVQLQLCNLLHVLHAQVCIGTALIDAEQKLIRVDRDTLVLQACHFGLAALQPAGGAFAAVLGVIVLGGVLYALIKGHGDGRAQICLNLHTLLRPHKDAVPVQMGGEGHALLGDLAQLCQTEHLKSAAVGQDRPVPAGKLVQAAHIRYQLVAGTQMQMVGVAQHDLRADILQILRRQAALDGTSGGNVLEGRGLNRAVHGFELAPPGAVLLLEQGVSRQRRHDYSFLSAHGKQPCSLDAGHEPASYQNDHSSGLP